ncbi:MAG TPA: hypothetical protein VGJ49_04775 [Gaiellaceae bacterium]
MSGIPREREWDAVVTMTSPASGDRLVFLYPWPELVLPEEGDAGNVVAWAIQALDRVIEPPYRAEAIRKEEDTWAVGALRVEVAELPADIDGDDLVLTVTEAGERELLVDGRPSLVGIDGLIWLVGDRFESFVVRAHHIEGSFWEIEIDPL